MNGYAESVEQLSAAVDAVLSIGSESLDGASVLSVLAAVESARRRLDAVEVELVAAAKERRLDGAYGATSVAALLAQALHVSPREAASRVRRAEDLGPRRTITGEPLPPILPVAAAALAAGELSVDHARVIGRTLDELPPDVSLETSSAVENLLVSTARHEDPVRLRSTAIAVLARLDPDGREPEEERQARRRELALTLDGDGTGRLRGTLTVEAAAVWKVVLDSLSRPLPAADGTPDDRSASQRCHDGLLDAGMRLLRSDTLPESGGVPVTVLVRVAAADLADPNALGVAGHGQRISMRQLMRLSGESELLPHVFDLDGSVLSRGREVRLATLAQRRALAARDGGCCFPSCTRPAAWAEVHHVVPWQDGGATDLDNLCLLCGHHHRTFESHGWRVVMRNGIPHWIPPPWLDAAQAPVRNTEHHPPDIRFDAVGANGRSG